MTKTVIAIRHVHFEDLGAFDDVLRRHGYAVRYCDACIDDIGGVDPLAPDLTVVLGGPISAYQELTYPFLGQELALLERRLTAARPTLGICLGAQLMARALGARVYPAPEKELGWGAVQLTEMGHSAILPGRRFYTGTATLSTSRRVPSFSLRQRSAQTRRSASDRHALACQFHPEITAGGFERWLVGHAVELAAVPGVSPAVLRQDTGRLAPKSGWRGAACLSEWLALLHNGPE